MRQLLPFAFAAMLLSLAVPAFADSTPAPATISITGEGKVMAAPDIAFVTIGVTTDNKAARDALTENTRSMTNLMATLAAASIDPKDIQTSGFSVSPQYVYPEREANGVQAPPHIASYQVQNGVTVKVRKLEALGTILDQVVTVGANTINSVSFSVDDTTKLLEEARKAAYADAETKAKTYAGAAGIGLGRILSISENQGAPVPEAYADVRAMAPMASAPVPVAAGQLTYSISVSVQWEFEGQAH
jgi:uncharacterized protein YggE